MITNLYNLQTNSTTFGARKKWWKFNHKYFFGTHSAVDRMPDRNINKTQVVEVIENGKIKLSKQQKSRKTPVFIAFWENLIVVFHKGKKSQEEYYIRTAYRADEDKFNRITKD